MRLSLFITPDEKNNSPITTTAKNRHLILKDLPSLSRTKGHPKFTLTFYIFSPVAEGVKGQGSGEGQFS